MDPLYCKHFGLVREPFNVTPNPTFLYRSTSHKEALAQLVYGIKARRGFVVLTGEVGTGKTTLIHCLLEELNKSTRTALIFNLVSTPKDLLFYVCEEFGLVAYQENHREVRDYLSLLNRFLLDCYRNGGNVALIIDEAQNLPPEVLESVRLLSNFETSQDKLLQILLVGQPELAARLNASELRQLKQRVALRHHLSPLTLTECREYMAKRLEIAGGTISLFSANAIEAVYAFSGGLPRLVNILCDNGLLGAYALRKTTVEVENIEEIARDLQLVSSPKDPFARRETLVTKPTESWEIGTREENFAPREPTSRIDSEDVERSPQDFQELSTASADTVPFRFFARLVLALTEAMGPMASLVVRDRVAAMGESLERFPTRLLEQLVDETSREILNETLKGRFRQAISREIHAITPARAES